MKRISRSILFFISLLPFELFSLNYSVNYLHEADSLYALSQYDEAVGKYWLAFESDEILRRDAELNFKVGYCYYKTGEYKKAKKNFENNKYLNGFLPEYTEYFSFCSTIKDDSLNSQVDNLGNNYLIKFPDFFLSDSVLFLIAEKKFNNGSYRTAYNYYLNLSNKKSKVFKTVYLKKQMALCKYELGEKTNAIDRIMQILSKYPSSKEALELVKFLEERHIETENMFFTIIDVYMNHAKYSFLNDRLEAFIRSEKDESLIEKARFYILQVYFQKGEYKTALFGLKSLLENTKNETLSPKILIYIARAYLRLGENENAAKSYIEYSKKYPRRRLAAEASWKSAWIYEEENDLNAALLQYRTVQKHWHSSDFTEEAKFREGLTLFRLKNFEEALQVFESIANSGGNAAITDRGKYWMAKTLDQLNRNEEANATCIQLGSRLFESYYTLKAYLNHRAYLDSVLQIKEKLAQRTNPLEQFFSNVALHVEKFERLFQIYNLLGKEFVLSEISGKKYTPDDLQGWVTLAEVYKKLEDYNRSFRIYDWIDIKYFSEYESVEKPFLLKEKYPLYFDRHIEKFCSKRNLEKNFFLAIIREESGFDKNAHSWADAYGLMQIIPRTAKELSAELNVKYNNPYDLFNEELNLELGIYYISKLHEKYNGTKELILAAYNAGPHRVNRWVNYNGNENNDFLVENIEFSQTRNYIKKVMKNYWIYSILNEIQ